jgi:heme-degrading monooxygenase HmoA
MTSTGYRRAHMIARTWRGWTATADADEYADYVRQTGISELQATPGNCGAYLLRRDDGDRTEILVVSLWRSLDDVRGFAGDDVDRAVFYPEDDRYLVGRDLRVRHFTVAAGSGSQRRAADARPEPCWL